MLRTRPLSAATAALLALAMSVAGASAAVATDDTSAATVTEFTSAPALLADEVSTEPVAGCVVVIWQMPEWADEWTPTWPQRFVSVHDSGCAATTIDASLFAVPDTCGTQYQLDKYYVSDVTSALIAGGVLLGYGPEEDLVPGLWGTLVDNPDCDGADEGLTAAVPLVTATDYCEGSDPNVVSVAFFTATGGESIRYRYTVNEGSPIDIVFEDGETEAIIAVAPLDEVEVTATAAQGFTLPQGYTPWSHTFVRSAFCPGALPATLAGADITPAVCETSPVRVALTDEGGVVWTLNGQKVDGNATHEVAAGSAVRLTAALEQPTEQNRGGWTWSDPEQQTQWNLGATRQGVCGEGLGSLALTGPAPILELLAAAVLALLAGTGAVTRRRRAKSQLEHGAPTPLMG